MNSWHLNVSKFAFIQICLIGIFGVQLLLGLFIEADDSYIHFLQYELAVIYLWSIVSASKESGFLNLYVMFLFTLGIFIFARIFLDLFGLFEWEWADKWNDFYLPLNIQCKVLSLLILSLLFTHLGALLGKSYLKERTIRFPYSERIEKWSILLFLLAVPGTFVKYIIQLKVILSQGYLAVYDGTLSHITYPIWTTGAISIMEFSYCLFLSSKPSKKKFLIISTIFFMLRMVDVLKGGRSRMFLPVIFLMWYYYSFYAKNVRVNWRKMFLIAAVGIVASQVLLEFRRGDVAADYSSDLFLLFFSQQGVSLLVFAYLIYYDGIFVNTGIPYILYPLSLFQTFEGQTFEFVQTTSSLGHKLTYFLSSSAYLNGAGIGSSYLGEFYDLGLVLFVLFSFLAGFLMRYFERLVRHYRIFMFLSFIIVPNFIYMPRSSFFPALQQIVMLLLFYVIVLRVSKNVRLPHFVFLLKK